jgi:hypothetical protein
MKTKKNYSFCLEPYSSSREYSICPKCGEKRFTKYIDKLTGACLDDDVGRCERTNSCGYHKPPREYFKSINNFTNDYMNNILNNNSMNNNSLNDNYMKVNYLPINSQENPAPSFKKETSEVSIDLLSNYYLYEMRESYSQMALFCALAAVFGLKRVEDAFEKYDVRVTKRYMYNERYGTVFIQKSHDGKIRQVKEMGYNTEGHRLKAGQDALVYKERRYIHSIDDDKIYYFGKYLIDTKHCEWKAQQCFFGEHLLNQYAELPVAIVESEKTAIISSICQPKYLWLATGGQYGCQWYNPAVYNVLRERKVILFPDLKAGEHWQMYADSMMRDGIDVSIIKLEEMSGVSRQDTEDGLDIGDFFIRSWEFQHPEAGEKIDEVIKKCPKASLPEFNAMFEALSKAQSQQSYSNTGTLPNTKPEVELPIGQEMVKPHINYSLEDVEAATRDIR